MPDEPAATPISPTCLSAADAVKLQIRAQKHRRVADHLQAEGDRVGPHFERAEARRLERTADVALNPVLHAAGPVTVGNGSEMAIGTKTMRPFLDTVRERPDMLAIEASARRMELADKADALTLAVDAAETIQAQNSLEKMLVHQMARAHAWPWRRRPRRGNSCAPTSAPATCTSSSASRPGGLRTRRRG